MNRKTSEVYRRTLSALRDRLARDLADLEVEPPLATETPVRVEAGPSDRGDSSVGTYEEIVNLGLVKNEADLLGEVNDALERLEEGRFGRCEVCRGEIRTVAGVPSRCCVACATEREPAV